MNTVISVALPVFGIIAAGLLAGRMGLMNASDSATLNRFVFRFAMPAALFGLTAGAASPGEADLVLLLSYGPAALIAIIVAYFLSKRCFALSGPEASAHTLASTLGNAVFLGLPIALSIDGWARPFVTLMLIEGTAVFAITSALMAPSREDSTGWSRIINYVSGPARNPLVIAMVTGFIYSALGFSFAGPVKTFFDILGRAAGPTALFSMGLFLAAHPLPPIKTVAGRVSMIAGVKLALLPGLTLGFSMLLGLDQPQYRGALALFVFVPTGVGAFIMASQYTVYEREAATAVSFTTILSLLTVPAVLMLFA